MRENKFYSIAIFLRSVNHWKHEFNIFFFKLILTSKILLKKSMNNQIFYDFPASDDDGSLCVDVTVESVVLDETTFDDVTWLLPLVTTETLFFASFEFDKSWANSTCVATRFLGVWMIWKIGLDIAPVDADCEKILDEVDRVVTNFGAEVNKVEFVAATAAPVDLRVNFWCPPTPTTLLLAFEVAVVVPLK